MKQIEGKNWLWLGLLALVAFVIPTLIALSHDVLRSYATTPDSDLIWAGQVLRFGDGLEQTFYDQTGHFYALILYGWLKTCFLFGWTPEPTQTAAIASEKIDDYMQSIIVGGRSLSIFMSSIFTILMMAGARSIGLSRPMVIAIGLVIATSHALSAQSQIMSVNLLSAMGVFAVFFALVQSQQTHGWKHVMWLFLTGITALLAMDTKVLAIIPLLGVCVLTLSLAPLRRASSPVNVDILTVTFAVFALAVSVPFLTVVALSWVVICMMLYGRFFNEPVARQIIAALALMSGLSIGAAVLLIWPLHRNLDWMVHFVESMARQTHI